MTAPTLNDFINAVNVFTGDASTGGVTETTRKIACINTAKDYFISQLGLPASEVVQQISYLDNNNIYPIQTGMSEPISLRYNNVISGRNNVRQNSRRKFEFMRADELYEYQDRQANDIVYWGLDYAQNINDIVIITNNIVPSQQINSFDTLTGLYALGDANTLALDSNIYEEGNASVSFTVTPSTGKAYIQFQLASPVNWSQYVNTGVFSVDWFVQSITGFANLSIQFGSDVVNPVSPSPTFSNYWKIGATVQANGNGFSAGAWNTVNWNWANATTTGSPVDTNITYVQFEFDFVHTELPTLPYWRFDDLELFAPDQMLFTYYTDQVVLAADNVTYQNDFIANSDQALFAQIDRSIVRGVAAYAACLYKPTSLEMDSMFVQKIADSILSGLQYRYPKKTLSFMERLRTVTRN